MPRKVTATLPDGRQVIYNNVPFSVTPAQMTARVQKDYGVAARSIDGGGPPKPGTADAFEARWSNLKPAQAKALLTQYGNGAGVNAPQTQALMRIAGMTTLPARSSAPAPTQAQRVAAVAKQAAAGESGAGFLNSLKAGIIRNAGFGIPERLAALGERYLPSAITGNTTNATYDQILQAARAKTDAEAAQSGTGNVIGSIVGGGLTGSVAARAGGALLGVAGRAAPAAVAPVANVLTRIAAAAPKTAAVARTVAAGAAGGAAQAAGQGSNVGEGAKEGAEGAVVLGAAAKGIGALARPVADFLGLPGAASVLRRYTSETAESLRAKMDDFVARTGTQPTVAEMLNPEDAAGLKKAIGVMPETSKAALASNVRTRAAAVGADQTTRTAALTRPQLDAQSARIAQNLAESRVGPQPEGVTAHVDPTEEETALANRAVRSPLDMQTAMNQRASNIMAPHDNRTLYPSVDALRPQHPEMLPDGAGVQMVDTNPEVSHMILTVAGSARRKADGITGSDVSGMLSKLGKIQGKGGTEGAVAGDAIDHITSTLGEDHPDVADAMQRMRDGFAEDNRFLEGMTEGGRTRLRSEAPATQEARNAFDTPEGAAGRSVGQAAQLERSVGGTPTQALAATNTIAGSPDTQAAISQNLGGDVGSRIADSATGVSDNMRQLAQLTGSKDAGSADLGQVMHGLLGLAPGTLPHTKALALSRLASLGVKLPEAASTNIVDSLFSQNPTQIARAMTFLNNAGDAGKAVLSSIAQSVGTGAASTALSTPAPDDGTTPPAPPEPQISAIPTPDPGDEPAAPAPADNDATDDSGAPSTVGEGEAAPAPTGGAVPIASSPYLPHLKNLYATENPAALDFYDRLAQQETGGQHFGRDGKAKISKAGAIGLMQVMPGTLPEAAKAAGVPVDMAALHNDPAYNRLVGSALAGKLLARYDGDPVKAAAAYNAGPGAVDKAVKKHGGDFLAHLPTETQGYVGAVS